MLTVDGGSIFFKTLIPNLKDYNIVWLAAGGKNSQTPQWMKPYTTYVVTSFIFQRYIAPIFRRSGVFLHIWCYVSYRWFTKRSIAKVTQILLEHKIDKIWIVGTCHLIPLAAALQRSFGVPMHVTVHDDIDRLPPIEAGWLRKDFAYLMQTVESIDMICDSMVKYYKEKYRVLRPIEVITVGGDTIDVPGKPVIRSTIKSLGYAGSIIYTEGFITLLKSLDLLNASRDEREWIELHVYSFNFPYRKIHSKYLKVYKTLPVEEFYDRLQAHDLLFVTMPFAEKNISFCRTSFPSKLISYLKAQLPILALGPEYATNIEFVNRYNVGLSCTMNDAEVVKRSILEYESLLEKRESASKNCLKAYMEDFMPEKFAQKFVSILFKN